MLESQGVLMFCKSVFLCIKSQGVLMFCKSVFLCIHSFVCNAPARAFLKNTMLLSCYYGCDTFVEAGKRVKSRMIFRETLAAQ
jgi:hypothetical protein